MAATAGTLTLIGKSQKTYTVDMYIPDATGTTVVMNAAGLAVSTGQNTFRVPEDCVVYDLSIGTAPTAVGAVLSVDSGLVNGGTVRWANQLQTLANRQKLAIPLRQGQLIQWTQF
jgi:hypothetical protein